MKIIFYKLLFSTLLCFFYSCSASEDYNTDDLQDPIDNSKRILSLGDSYTIGQSVCESCSFPKQLKDSLVNNNDGVTFELNIIAQTGWTTSDLISNIVSENPSNNYDLVTLLIGVNNQYQGAPFSLYESEFPQLVQMAMSKVQGDKTKVIIVSIPDYAYTPFGQFSGDPSLTSTEIDMYNAFAENYCNENNITFVNITDITREGLNNPDLVASDDLHPSELAYTRFVERLLPLAIEKIQ
ncbi:lysophospholipase [Winogradskyella sp. J14-2]|uniref:SGNH/GDSL hydrolase family protein n=1 Tax=Winogradskyella sp. J14-2 TaxID=1936080 RepID=UPI0009727379|nr:SGNH/GDSL hydrolase family protein [Winogradskyella sp. J14-2]APY08108.1 lysophospholipase [Winogradskyella sp. J14-2]